MNNTIKHKNNDFDVLYTEKCVNCNTDTGIPYDMHISMRSHYVEGAGQLCNKCYIKIYNTIEIPVYEQTR